MDSFCPRCMMSEFDCKDAGCCCSCHTAIAPGVHPTEPQLVSDEVDTIDECECPPEESGPVMCMGCGGTVDCEAIREAGRKQGLEDARKEFCRMALKGYDVHPYVFETLKKLALRGGPEAGRKE